MVFELGVVAVVLLVPLLASRRWPMAPGNRATSWRFVPLASSGVIMTVAFATFGGGLVLAPVAALLWAMSARRLASPRGYAYWLGSTLTALLVIGFLSVVATVVWAEMAG